ncbi:MAG: hypothetical protein FJ297_08555 [Planctomycetes bacterium]|nr:hypothetical protein [Planctomycetota bacterium]
MVESILRSVIDHPHRKWIVITTTCLFGLAVTWPAVDDYTAARQRRAELAVELEQTAASTAQLAQFEKDVKSKMANVAAMESRIMTEERVQQFRNELVQLARVHNCRMRRMRVGEPREREWYKDDHPLALRPVSDKAEKTPFVLRTRQFSVSVSGTLAGVSGLLADLAKKNQLTHAAGLKLQKSEEEGDHVVLDLEMLLIELAKPEPKKASA